MILQCDQKTFQASQGPKRDYQDQWDPQHRVDPVRRLILDLGDQRGSHDNGAGDHDDEYGRPVAGVGKAEIEAAHVDLELKVKNPSNNLPLPQRGHRHRRPAIYGDGVFSEICLPESSIFSFLRFDYLATYQANPKR
jgi:hypothetical protein